MAQSGQYAGKVVVITGASSGIGAALAQEVAGRGGSVVLGARRMEKLREVASLCGASAHPVQCDVTRRGDVQRLFDEAVRRFGHVDVWVNNAGRGISKPWEALTDDDVDAMVRDNFKSVLYCMQVVVPHFKARGQGAVVNVSSMLSRTPFAAFRSAYSAAKAAANSITETARMELQQGHPEIRFVTVLPGVVATDFGNHALGGGPDSRTLPYAQDVDEVARIIADQMLTARGDVYTRPDAMDRVIGYLRSLA